MKFKIMFACAYNPDTGEIIWKEWEDFIWYHASTAFAALYLLRKTYKFEFKVEAVNEI